MFLVHYIGRCQRSRMRLQYLSVDDWRGEEASVVRTFANWSITQWPTKV